MLGLALQVCMWGRGGPRARECMGEEGIGRVRLVILCIFALACACMQKNRLMRLGAEGKVMWGACAGGRQVLFTDTVGFIQKLPTQLVAAFRATLEGAPACLHRLSPL